MSGNLLQTEDKYSAVSFGFAPNRWYMTDDEKSCVLSVNDEYNYSKLLELFNAIDADKREAIALAVTGKKEFALSDGEIAQIKQDTADTLARLRAVTQKINAAFDFLPLGDSRAYIFGKNGRCITSDDIYKHNVLSKCIGSFPWSGIGVKKGKLRKGQGILVCSDGIYKAFLEDELLAAFQNTKPFTEKKLKKRLDRLAWEARQRGILDDQAAVAVF